MEQPVISPTAEPFFFQGSSIGCMLVHGFTGTPKEMRPMGEYLAQQGYTVLGIRLAGHATEAVDMVRMRWRDWLANVEDGLNLLQNVTQKIFVVGLSMGGVLSLIAAARYPVSGVVAMSTPFAMQEDWRIRFLRPLSWIQPAVAKGSMHRAKLDAPRKDASYPVYPTRSLAEMADLQKVMRDSLSDVRAPALLIHSRADKTVNSTSMQCIYDRLGSQDRQMLWLQQSGHVITREPESELVFESVFKFIQEHQ